MGFSPINEFPTLSNSNRPWTPTPDLEDLKAQIKIQKLEINELYKLLEEIHNAIRWDDDHSQVEFISSLDSISSKIEAHLRLRNAPDEVNEKIKELFGFGFKVGEILSLVLAYNQVWETADGSDGPSEGRVEAP